MGRLQAGPYIQKFTGNSMTPEGIVVEAVQQYFLQPKFQKFSTKKEDRIRFGSRLGFADVVLIGNKGNRSVIVECKRPGVEREGPDQLKSYLCATDTPFGLFANSTEPNDWKFYENLGRNQFGDLTRSEFESRVVKNKKKLINRVSNFFRRFPRSKPDESEKIKSYEEPAKIEINGEPDASNPVVTFRKPHIIIKDRPLQNEYRDNTVDVNLNGSEPYYNEQNGFYWAANHQGIAECVPQHIKRIIHNEELEIAFTRDELEQEINYLREGTTELEEQKREYEQEIAQQTQELAKKKEELAGLEVYLKTLMITGTELSPIETTPDGSNPELFNASNIESTPDSPAIKRLEEEINDLIQEKVQIEQTIDEKIQALTRKKAELAGFEVELEGPTEIELNPITTDPTSHEAPSVKSIFSRMSLITAIISTVFFVCLATYLFIFYASAVDKAFFLNTEAIQAQLDKGTYAGVNDVVNPSALFKAFQGEWNLFVVMFPFVFLAFAIALDYFWEQGKWMYLVALFLAVLTLVFDGILAIQISQKIHQAKVIMGQETEQWTFRINDLNMWTVIFCGFIVSILVSIVYHVMNQRWKVVSPPQEKFKVSNIRELKIKSEKTQREADIAVLKVEIDNLQNEIDHLKEKYNATQQKIIKTVKTPIETQIAVLKVGMDNLQNEINRLRGKDTDIQQEIENVQARIVELSNQQNKRVVNRSKMESQINQFLNGWCRFVAHSGNGASEVSPQIDRIKQIATDTLDQYYQGVPDYSA